MFTNTNTNQEMPERNKRCIIVTNRYDYFHHQFIEQA